MGIRRRYRSHRDCVATLLLPPFLLLSLVGMPLLGCTDEARDPSAHAEPDCNPSASSSTPSTARMLEDAIAEEDPLCRARRLADALEALGRDEMPALQDFLDSKGSLLEDGSLSLIVRWHAGLDPTGAFEQARHIPRGRRALAVRSALERWAEIDPPAAAATLDAIQPKKRLEGSSLAVARGWESSGRPGLDAFVAARPSTRNRNAILSDLLTRMRARDGSEAMTTWVDSLSEDLPNDLRLSAHQSAASLLARDDIELARQWIDQIENPAYQRGLIRTVATHWVLEDASAAMAWVGATPAGKDRDRAVRETYRTLSKQSREKAAEWFEAEPYADWLEPALALHLGALAHRDAPAAIARIDDVKDADRRRKATVAILLQWRRQDRAAADAWLAESDLPSETRKRIVSRKRKRIHSGPNGRDGGDDG